MPNPKPVRGGLYRKLAVNVDADTIEAATVRSSSHCMIADAVRKSLPSVRSVQVDLQTIRFTDPKSNRRYIYLTPPAAQRALIAFDQGERIEPFEFRQSQPVQVVEAGYKTASDGTRKTRATGATRKVHARRGATGRPIIENGRPLPANAALSTGRGKVRQYGLRQVAP